MGEEEKVMVYVRDGGIGGGEVTLMRALGISLLEGKG